jgi:two-component system cell cycle sensor histidine kinase/response regulator CckA
MVQTRTAGSYSQPKLSGIVLLVEDEPTVRVLLRRLLEIQGLTVRAVESPEDAIAAFGRFDDPIDVLLTDLQLPGMSGVELARRARKLRPALPVVFMSGYPREVALTGLSRDFGQRDYLEKPFTPAQLGETVGRVLAATPPPSGSDTIPG